MGTTSKMLIPYPEATGLVKDGWEDMKDIATQVDAKSGLVLLNTTSFSAVASQSLPNDTFTSSFSHYRIMLDITTTAVNSDVFMRMRASGTDNTSSNYMWAGRGYQSSGAAFDKNSAGTSTSFVVGVSKTSGIASWIIDLFNPKSSTIQTSFSSFGQWQDGATAIVELPMAGAITVTTAYDAITIFGGGNLTGTMSTYGYNK